MSPEAEASDLDWLASLSPEAVLVCYCSLGYRSARMTQRLVQAGITQVLNLEGSLFQWANEERPLWAGQESARLVHPFSDQFKVYLKPAYRLQLAENKQNDDEQHEE